MGWFTDEEMHRIEDAVLRKLSDPICRLCASELEIETEGPTIVPLQASPEYQPDSALGVPCIVLVCRNCGHLHFLSMRTLGLIDIARRQFPSIQ